MLETWFRMLASNLAGHELLMETTNLTDQNRGPHIRPSGTVVGKLREHRSRTLLGRRHDPKADDHRHKAKHVDATEDALCQRKMLCGKDVERSHCNDRYPGGQGGLPAFRDVVNVVDNNQGLDQSTYDETINSDDR